MKEQDKKTKNNDEYEKDYKAVIAAEKKHLNLGERTSGLAVSGGGIRSASFGLGVMQALVADNELSKMDYMSTVSGGGYLGSALTWALKQGGAAAGTTPKNFPLGRKGVGDNEENKLLNFIRQHSNYLLPVNSLGAVSLVSVALRSMLLSLFVYCAVLTIVMTVLLRLHLFSDITLDPAEGWPVAAFFKGIFFPVAIGLFLLFLAGSLFYSVRTFLNWSNSTKGYLSFIRGQKLWGVVWKLLLTLALIGTLPYIEMLLDDAIERVETGGISVLTGALVGAWQYLKAQNKESSSGAMSGLTIYVGAFALVYGLLLLAYTLGEKIVPHGWTWFLSLVGITLFFGLFVNLNLVGPHRIWRNRLMEAFMPNKDEVTANKWKPATKADHAMMEDMCDANNPKPYHIINTNLILVDSTTVKYRGRGGDNFIISPLYCGSVATGWRTTKTFQKKDSRGITLATAMATSAAALNPNAAVSGEGMTRNTVIAILLSILNLRLGYWTTNPKKDPFPLPPNFFMPGLMKEVTHRKMEETSRYIMLSDGGHFENLAIYELIRRRVKLIVLSDGGADPEFNFDDLANAVEKVRVDFDAKIAFKDSDLNDILGGTAGESLFDKKYNIAKKGYAIADIWYNDGTKGNLVYIKLAMIPELPTDIYAYKGVNPTFPHQSTADQFFNEKQFEAYRELGYNVTRKLLGSEEWKKLQQ